MPRIPLRLSRISTLDDLLIRHRGAYSVSGRTKAALDLDAAMEIEDPILPDADETFVRSHRRGQQAFLLGFKLQMVASTLLTGWVTEFNDGQEVVIALRRQAARGG